ncbi:Kiwa anti-phage protein KwaB-like domain-containing protein [Mesorhizobium sp.]|uniref:Kiwa anti-phage protein KwaB-like domain-containing protein n=1 Tax=Mesorhizobium sp. TaxID=1871066 RepID=UPI000FE63F0E|nr:Kiwa anti-phage protein KwaB-like domain-containing protein [Mesorhizobium sp.]RWP73478.1 MAG: DUF4868 domain-containing protein [Mesorhizobium sp.]
MTIAILRATLPDCINLAGATVTVCLASRRPNQAPALHRLQLSDDLAASFLTSAEDALRKLNSGVASGDLDLQNYDAAVPQDRHEVEVHAPGEGTTQSVVVNSLGNLAQLPVFDGDNRIINKLEFHVIAVQRAGMPDIYLFRKYSKTKELGRSKKLITLFSAGTFDKITDPVFVFDEYVDAFWISPDMAIINKDNYHRIFNFFAQVIQHANNTLTTIRAAVAIDNADEFVADCTRNALILVKLRGISQRDYLGQLNMDMLAGIIAAYNLPIAIAGEGADRRLVYDKQHKWKFLRLIDDGFLTSNMTGNNYEVTGKRQA